MADRERFPWEHEGETLALDTPEQTKVEYQIAPFGTRLVAALDDQLWIGLGTIALAVGALAMLFVADALNEEAVGYVVAGVIVAHFLLTTLYHAWWEIRAEGLTPGKRRRRIRAVLATGHGITPGAALVRNLARIVDELPVLWLVPALSPGRRRIGDWLAGTVVISEGESHRPANAVRWLERLAPSYRELAERRYYFSTEIAARLFPEDLDLIEYASARMASMLPSRRAPLLREVALKYVERLELGAERERVTADPERFLQELGLFLRERFERGAR